MLILFLAAVTTAATAKYDAYIQHEVHPPAWQWSDKLRNGQIAVEPSKGKGDLDIGGALIHDWTGRMFIPGVKLNQVVSFLQDFNTHEKFYGPEVVNTRLRSRDGNVFKIDYRLVQSKVITVVLDVDQTVTYFPVSATRTYSAGEATRIVDTSGKDRGYLWRLNTYWTLEEKDGGVYLESRTVSLSRTPPLGLGWLFNPIVSSLPGESLGRLLTATRKAVLSR